MLCLTIMSLRIIEEDQGCMYAFYPQLTRFLLQALQLYNLAEDPTESRNLVRWMNPARFLFGHLNLSFCMITSDTFFLAMSRKDIIERLQDIAIEQYR